jgi:hypothetical protein
VHGSGYAVSWDLGDDRTITNGLHTIIISNERGDVSYLFVLADVHNLRRVPTAAAQLRHVKLYFGELDTALIYSVSRVHVDQNLQCCGEASVSCDRPGCRCILTMT